MQRSSTPPSTAKSSRTVRNNHDCQMALRERTAVRYPQCRSTVYVPDDAVGFIDPKNKYVSRATCHCHSLVLGTNIMPPVGWFTIPRKHKGGASITAAALGLATPPETTLELEHVHG